MGFSGSTEQIIPPEFSQVKLYFHLFQGAFRLVFAEHFHGWPKPVFGRRSICHRSFMKTSQVANFLGVSDNTIRNYSKEFSEFLSKSANPDKYAERYFTDLDVEVLGVIVGWKKQGYTYGQIRDKLEKGHHFMADQRIDRGGSNQQALMIIEQYQRQIDVLTNLVMEQSKSLERQIDRLQQQLNEAHQEIGKLKAQLEAGLHPSTAEMSELSALIREVRELVNDNR